MYSIMDTVTYFVVDTVTVTVAVSGGNHGSIVWKSLKIKKNVFSAQLNKLVQIYVQKDSILQILR